MTVVTIAPSTKLLNRFHLLSVEKKSSNVTFEEVREIVPSVDETSTLSESKQLNQTSKRQSWPCEPPRKSTLSGNAAEAPFYQMYGVDSAASRRRTYNGPFNTQTPTTTAVKTKSRFSIASFTSLQTLESYRTAKSYVGSWRTAPSIIENSAKQSEGSVIRRTFRKLLQSNGFPFSSLLGDEEEAYDEYDWCGRGMHVDFKPGEMVPLEVCDSAGHGSTSSIDVVKCRRIKLARKLTHLTTRTNQKDLLREVHTLQKLKHAHVIQLIGTYRQGRKFAALLYPVADIDLAEYLEEARFMPDAVNHWIGTSQGSNHERAHQYVLSEGSVCLISALRYVHESGVKHMDIKPANILLKRYEPAEAYSNRIAYKIYLCDFGIAQGFVPHEQSQTETYPGNTPMYASPEVAAHDVHGRASDVFSLGCVLLEMATVYSGLTVESLKMVIRDIRNASSVYHKNLDRVRSWISTLENMRISNAIILKMLQERAEDRPSLVRQQGMTNVIDVECLHHHDPPDLFEEDKTSPPVDKMFTSNPMQSPLVKRHSTQAL